MENLSFSTALDACKKGHRIAREGWNGKGMYVWYMPPLNVPAEWCKEPVLKQLANENGGNIECLGTLRMYTADKKVLTGWLASQTDLLADDWQILPQ